jgi:Tfp pilus assembly protein FimT
MRYRGGATLIEAVFAIALTAILCAIAIPRAARLLDRIELRGAVSEIEMMFAVARHAAIARGVQVTLDIDLQRRTVAVREAGEVIRSRDVGASHGVDLSATRTSITYAANGLGYGAANMSLMVSRSGLVDTIVVSRLGRVRH